MPLLSNNNIFIFAIRKNRQPALICYNLLTVSMNKVQKKKIYKVHFVAFGFEQLSISLLSSIAKKEGCHVFLSYNAALFNDRWNLNIPILGKIFDETKKVLREIEQEKPDLLVFSPLTSTYKWSLEIAKNAKKINPRTKTIFGGVHVSAIPEMTIKKKEVDFVVVGEGDFAFPKIINHIRENKLNCHIPNTLYINSKNEIIRGAQEKFNQNLDNLPFFDKEIWEKHIKIDEKYMTMVSRGCPHKCSFCFNSFFSTLSSEKDNSSYLRFRSVNNVIEELLWAKKRYKKIKFVDFQDDNFTVNKKWLKDFLELYKKEIDIPFQCLAHSNYIDEDVIRWLSEAGCRWIQMGIQSADDDFKRKNLGRYENKENIVKSIILAKKYGIKLKTDHMFGLPNEPLSAQEKALLLYRENTPDRIQTYWTCYLPGTKMLREDLKKNLITEQELESLYEGSSPRFFRESNKDNVLSKIYKDYEFIFKILPVLPTKIRLKIAPGKIKHIPSFVKISVSFIAEIIISKDNPDYIFYKKHYIFHLKKFLLQRLSRKNINATNIN